MTKQGIESAKLLTGWQVDASHFAFSWLEILSYQ